MPSSFRLSIGLAILLGAGGCAVDLGLGRNDAPARTYWLTPPDVQATAHPAEVTVTAVPGLETDQMLALDHDRRLVPYAGARWNGPIPQLVQSLAGRALDGDRGEGTLRIEVRRFFVEQDQESGGAATIELAAWHPTHEAGARVFVARRNLAEARLGAVAAAFQQAIDQVMSDIAAWLAEPHGASAAAPRSPAIESGHGSFRPFLVELVVEFRRRQVAARDAEMHHRHAR